MHGDVGLTSITSAYRADVEANGGPFGDRDGAWILVGTLLQHAAVADGVERARFIDSRRTIAPHRRVAKPSSVVARLVRREVDRW